MRSDRTRIPGLIKAQVPRAHYTYLGQFIVHDLTLDDTSLRNAYDYEWHELANRHSPWLDLEPVYGDGPGSRRHAHLYEADGASFKVGGARLDGKAFDVPIGRASINPLQSSSVDGPLFADPRNNANAIVRQIHAIFLLLHNCAVSELQAESYPGDLFSAARRRVVWQYQWIVIGDYLTRVCARDVYESVIGRGERRLHWPRDGFAIPVEFSHATARFGHSMVRPFYQLSNFTQRAELAQLFSAVHSDEHLDPSLAIDWKGFCTSPADSIDTAVAVQLFQLPNESVHPFVASMQPSTNTLPLRTLVRGAALGLTSGEDLADALTIDSDLNQFYQLDPQYNPFEAIDRLGIRGATPLWYYVLLEAELEKHGGCLGTLGSRVLAEVLHAALVFDSQSFFQNAAADPSWRPQPWKMPDGSLLAANSFEDLTKVVALHEL